MRGDGQPFHLYEVACFLKLHGANGAFWEEWRGLHAPELRRLEAVCFRLAAEWFGCRLSQVAQQETEQLPASTRAWLDEFALEPAASLYDASKAELWLHVSLLNSRRDESCAVKSTKPLAATGGPPSKPMNLPIPPGARESRPANFSNRSESSWSAQIESFSPELMFVDRTIIVFPSITGLMQRKKKPPSGRGVLESKIRLSW